MNVKLSVAVSVAVAMFSSAADAAPVVSIRLPERVRLLEHQYFDLRVEAVNLATPNPVLHVRVNGSPASFLPTPEVTSNNDQDPSADRAWTFRKISLPQSGVWTLTCTVRDGSTTVSAESRIGVQNFNSPGHRKKNLILFIGDAMGTAYRDAGRIVAKSTDNRFREGFFDDLQSMDTMPVSGLAMTYAMNNVVPDSANTASAWATGNKTINGALGVFPDNDDWRFSSANVQGTKVYALNNPRIETLWEYLKRRHGYKTGIVSTADITDATPAGQGGHSITRTLLFDIARQYVDGVFRPGPAFDVILGGGKEKFISRTLPNSGDTRNLAAELQAAGFTYVENRTALNALPDGSGAPGRLLGLFRTSNMNVAYDKLGLVRPPDEPTPSFGGFTDQPFLDEMTQKAIASLDKGSAPYILMVEAASIDKQSHPNHAAGQIWDTIEFDKAIAVGRESAEGPEHGHGHERDRTLVIVSADHDQSLHLLGVVDATVPEATLNIRSGVGFTGLTGEVEGFPDYADGDGDGYPENTNDRRLAVGYRTGDHTASSVPVTAEGPGALLFTGYYDQTDIFFKMAYSLSHETRILDQALEAMRGANIVGPNY